MSAIDEQVSLAMSLLQEAIAAHTQADAKMQQSYAVLSGMGRDGAPKVTRLSIPWMSQLGPQASFSNSDCGPACVAMLLRSLGRMVTVDEISQATGLTRNFTFTLPAHLIAAAGRYQVKLQRALNLSIGILRDSIEHGAPVILLVHYGSLPKRHDPKFTAGHWIVITGCTSNGIICYHDPYWPDTTGQHLEIADGDLARAMVDCARDGNTPNQGLMLVKAAG